MQKDILNEILKYETFQDVDFYIFLAPDSKTIKELEKYNLGVIEEARGFRIKYGIGVHSWGRDEDCLRLEYLLKNGKETQFIPMIIQSGSKSVLKENYASKYHNAIYDYVSRRGYSDCFSYLKTLYDAELEWLNYLEKLKS